MRHRRRAGRAYRMGLSFAAAVAIVAGAGTAGDAAERGPATLEDLFGETGEKFQAAVGIINFEKAAPNDDDPVAGYGIGIDDMYVEWREFALGPDLSDCALAGACAALTLTPFNIFDADQVVTVTVLDSTTAIPNDCNDDGDTVDPGDDQDCDDDGVDDIVVHVTSDRDLAGERFVLNEADGAAAGAAGLRYRANFAITAGPDAAGVVAVGSTGRDEVRAVYLDADDGSGQPCASSADPAATGRVEGGAFVLFLGGARILAVNALLSDNGDDDGFADTRERVEMRLTVRNATGVPLTGVTARLSTNDPNVACVLDFLAAVPDMAPGEAVLTSAATPLVFEVADVDRTALGLDHTDALTATFDVTFDADQFDGASVSLPLTIDLDLDAAGGSAPGTYFEGFESGTFGTFTTSNLDAATASLEGAQGYRCQYSDPDWPNSNSYGQSAATTCYPGNPGDASQYWWQVVGPTSGPNGFRSFGGTHALYMGSILGDDELTTPLGVLEAIASDAPINLGWDRVCEVSQTTPCDDAGDCPAGEACLSPAPELVFRHQISLVDSRAVSAPPSESADKAVVMAQLADAATGAPVGSWMKLTPYVNGYDMQNTDNYTNCMFDPTDDGTTEDDFFDPTDPDRRLGPSSTCYPELVYAYLGDTDAPFAEGNLGRATDGPGLEGSAGLGTWVASRVDLSRFRGRRLRLRFLNAGIKAGNSVTHESIFGWNPTPVDDGWFIDDVEVTGTLATPATVTTDDTDNSGLPGACAAGCTTATAVLTATPAASPAPGIAVTLRGDQSFVDTCPGGAVQYRFSRAGAVLREWSAGASYAVAPAVSTTYGLEFRCLSAPDTCVDATSLRVPVACPGSVAVTATWDQVTASGAFEFGTAVASYLAAVGDLASLRAGSYASGVTSDLSGTAFATAGPPSGAGEWYLFRKAGGAGCNTAWSSFGAGECAAAVGTGCPAGGRDAALP